MTAAIQPLYTTLGAFNHLARQPTPMSEVHRKAVDEKQEELRAAYERISQLESILGECLDYFDDRADVVDGDYGEPRPNAEMKMMCAIDEVL